MVIPVYRVTSTINGNYVQVLSEGGSTHNFFQEQLAVYPGLPITPSKHFTVQVGNGETLHYFGHYSKVSVLLQQQIFEIDLYVIHLQGADLVLGVQWLELLGPVTTDYKALTMDFTWRGFSVHLQGDLVATAATISSSSLSRLCATGEVGTCYQLWSLTISSPTIASISFPDADIAAILH
ncbi:RVP_2 domain-containing protein [Cephalotus follicularis]|uniref:RVP_2 domain-containing protein n=1 Tax=Cephalotus follicularis TaxID=3775 RepID=A0A1Q3C334_CEPFO|nr:RVP_2 domain-containing protein [Cephalotus follicularis]